MLIRVAQYEVLGATLAVALVPSEFTEAKTGDAMLLRVQPYYPTQAIMLVSVEENGFRAFAHFQTHSILAMMQLEMLNFTDVDLSVPPVDDSELPF